MNHDSTEPGTYCAHRLKFLRYMECGVGNLCPPQTTAVHVEIKLLLYFYLFRRAILFHERAKFSVLKLFDSYETVQAIRFPLSWWWLQAKRANKFHFCCGCFSCQFMHVRFISECDPRPRHIHSIRVIMQHKNWIYRKTKEQQWQNEPTMRMNEFTLCLWVQQSVANDGERIVVFRLFILYTAEEHNKMLRLAWYPGQNISTQVMPHWLVSGERKFINIPFLDSCSLRPRIATTTNRPPTLT